jgi:PadR family transcriptional regulator, regulatory protein AphA
MSSKSRYTGSLSPEYTLLGFLAQQPDHGYELHQRLIAELGQVWHISQSQVYSILKRLEARGDIRGSLQEQEKLPNRLLFHLTPSGKARFDAWLEQPTRSSIRAIRVEFITRLYFASQASPAVAADLVDSQVEETLKGLSRLRKVSAELPPEQAFNRLGLELRIRQLASILEWLEDCRSVVDRRLEVQEGGQV